MTVGCKNQLIIKVFAVYTGGFEPVRYGLGCCISVGILTLYGTVFTVFTGIGRYRGGIEGPVRKINTGEGLGFGGFLSKLRTEKFLLDPLLEICTCDFIGDFERNNTAGGECFFSGSFHNLIGTAVRTFARYCQCIIDGFRTTALTNYGFLFRTPVAVGFFILST